MKLRFIGTGGGVGNPGLWCTCEQCQAARLDRGRSLRLRSALLIDDRLLIDCGPDLVAAAIWHGLDLSGVRTLLITHEHEDHLYPFNLELRRKAAQAGTRLPTLEVYGNARTVDIIRHMKDTEETLHLRTHAVRASQSWETDGYRVTALRAQHGTIESLFYAVADGHGSVLYALDTGPFPEETWSYLTNPPDGRRFRFDVVVIDATGGVLGGPSTGHMNLAQVRAQRDRLAASGLLKPDVRVMATHFSHRQVPIHRGLEEHLSGSGIEAAYDGQVVTLSPFSAGEPER